MILQIRFLCFFHVKLNMASTRRSTTAFPSVWLIDGLVVFVCVPAGPSGYRWRDYSAMAVIMAGMAFGFYHLYRVCVRATNSNFF